LVIKLQGRGSRDTAEASAYTASGHVPGNMTAGSQNYNKVLEQNFRLKLNINCVDYSQNNNEPLAKLSVTFRQQLLPISSSPPCTFRQLSRQRTVSRHSRSPTK